MAPRLVRIAGQHRCAAAWADQIRGLGRTKIAQVPIFVKDNFCVLLKFNKNVTFQTSCASYRLPVISNWKISCNVSLSTKTLPAPSPAGFLGAWVTLVLSHLSLLLVVAWKLQQEWLRLALFFNFQSPVALY